MRAGPFISGILITSLVLIYGFDVPEKASAANQVVIYLKSSPGQGNQTFNVPTDWNSSSNSIECIGSGAKGASSLTGGGGGAYAKITNLSLTGGGTATYAIGGSATTTGGTKADETYFNSTASSTASLSCSYGKFGGAGATTANSTGSTKFAGGTNGNKGGGGAGGPHGAGNNGSLGTGGSGDAGNGGAGGSSAFPTSEEEEGFPCGNGDYGTEYSGGPVDTAGSGGGGGGGVPGFAGGCDGGGYGGGGGANNGLGSQGIIIIFYTPSTSGFTGTLARFKILGGRVLIRGGRVLFH